MGEGNRPSSARPARAASTLTAFLREDAVGLIAASPTSSPRRCARTSPPSTRGRSPASWPSSCSARSGRPRAGRRRLGRRRPRVRLAVGLRRRLDRRPRARLAGRGGPDGPGRPRPLAARARPRRRGRRAAGRGPPHAFVHRVATSTRGSRSGSNPPRPGTPSRAARARGPATPRSRAPRARRARSPRAAPGSPGSRRSAAS